MRHRQGRDRCFAELKRAIDDVRHRNKIAGKAVLPVESEFINARQVLHGFRRRVDRDRPEIVGIAAEIVEPHNVVRVRMSEDDRIEPPNIFPQRLGAEIRAGVNHPGALGRLDIDRRAQPLIARIWGMTNLAVAADRRHALRGSGPEEGKAKLRVESWELRVQKEIGRAISLN